MSLLEKITSWLRPQSDEPVEGPAGGPHPAPPEDTVDDRRD